MLPEDVNTTAKEVYLCGNSFTSEKCYNILPVLGNCCNAKVLDFGKSRYGTPSPFFKNNIGDAGAEIIAKTFNIATKLEKFGIADAGIGYNFMEHVTATFTSLLIFVWFDIEDNYNLE